MGLAPDPPPLPSQEFAGEGLRTLVVACRDLDEDWFAGWWRRHHEASTALDQREKKLSDLYEEIEQDMVVGGQAWGPQGGREGGPASQPAGRRAPSGTAAPSPSPGVSRTRAGGDGSRRGP